MPRSFLPVLAAASALAGVPGELYAQPVRDSLVCRTRIGGHYPSHGCAAIRIQSDAGRWGEAASTLWYVQLAEVRERPRMEPTYVGPLKSADTTIIVERMSPPYPAPQDTATVLVFAVQPLLGPVRIQVENLPLRTRLVRTDTARVLLTFVAAGEAPTPSQSVRLTFRHLEQLP